MGGHHADGGGHHAVRDQMLLYAEQMQTTGKYVGIFPFVVWACARQQQVQLLFGDGLLDVISTYAPWAEAATATCAIPRVAAFCKVFRCQVDGVDHVIVRHLLNNADLASGKHWVAAVKCPGIEKTLLPLTTSRAAGGSALAGPLVIAWGP